MHRIGWFFVSTVCMDIYHGTTLGARMKPVSEKLARERSLLFECVHSTKFCVCIALYEFVCFSLCVL